MFNKNWHKTYELTASFSQKTYYYMQHMPSGLDLRDKTLSLTSKMSQIQQPIKTIEEKSVFFLLLFQEIVEGP